MPRAPILTPADVEREIVRLFGDPAQSQLVIRVHDADGESRIDAFRELLDSLSMHGFRTGDAEILVRPPDANAIARALSVLSLPRLKRQLFGRILTTIGKQIVEPLAAILETTPGGALHQRMRGLREHLMGWVGEIKLTHETQRMLTDDIARLLSDDYLAMLAEHEEKVQRPRVAQLAQDILRLIATIFEAAFRRRPDHAHTIATAISRRMDARLTLRQSPTVIREHIIDSMQQFLWIETGTEIAGAAQQLFLQPKYRGLSDGGPREIDREMYRDFAEACWDIVAENC
jgi:hypothetical protein